MQNINGVAIKKILKRNSREELLFYKEYIPHIKEIAKYYSLEYKRYGFNEDVYFSLGLTSLNTALQGYLRLKGFNISFYNYWRIAFKNAVLDYLDLQEEVKMYLTGQMISIDNPYVDSCGVLHDVIGVEDEKEDYNGLFEKVETIIKNDFGHKKLYVDIGLSHFIYNMTPEEVAERYNIPTRQVYYVLKKIRDKLKSKLRDIY